MCNCCGMNSVTAAYIDAYCEIYRNMENNMTGINLTDSISQNFINQMIPHHEAAVQMCENILKYSDCQAVRCLAENIIAGQSQSIADMKKIYNSCACFVNTDSDSEYYQLCFDEICQEMFYCMRNARTVDSVNANFLYEMIPHHAGAVRMAMNAMKYPISPALRSICCDIIRTQNRQIGEMRSMLANMGCRT